MKKIILSALALATAIPAFAQWTTGTGTIFPTTLTNKVGIGNNAPSTWLHVLGITEQFRLGYDATKYTSFTTSSGGALTITRNGAATNAESIEFAGSNGELAVISNNTSGAALYVRGNSTADIVKVLDGTTNVFNIKDGGNVGIGTNSPHSLLNVSSGSGQSYSSDFGMFSISPSSDDNKTLSFGYDSALGTNGSGWIQTVKSGVAYTPLLLNPTWGNVGIGTTTPTDRLHVAGDGGVTISNNGFNGLKLYNLADNSQKMHLYWRPTDDVVEMNTGSGSSRQLSFITGGIEGIRINQSGYVGMGSTIPDEKLTVNGKIHAKEVKVDLNIPGPDYVFEPDYKLASLDDLKAYVDKNHHLPEIPSAAQMEKDGINLSDMNMKLLKKVEELTLYLLEKQKQLKAQQDQLQAQDERLKKLEALLFKNESNK